MVGPSGCGKTTLLRLLCGLISPSEGAVLLDGVPVTEPPRQVALVFQDYGRSLFPLTARGNVMLRSGGRGLSRPERVARAESLLAELGLPGSSAYPWQLSGWDAAAHAIARALAPRPELLLLDEPFASVDALTRAELQDVLLRVHDGLGDARVTIAHVTHDIDEAVYLADRVLVLAQAPGRRSGRWRSRSRSRARRSAGPQPARFLVVRDEIHADRLPHRHTIVRSVAG